MNAFVKSTASALAIASIAAALTVVTVAAPRPARADDGAAVPAIVTFDEIDHVYTSGDVPPPGDFDASLREIDRIAAHPRKRGFLDGAMHGLGVAGSQLGNATSIVGASGEVGQTLHIASGAAALVPVADALGLAGRGRLDTLAQTYVLPRISPSGAQLLSGYLAAQTEAASRYPHASRLATAAAPVPTAAAADDPYARGSLRTYTIADTGRVRVEDPDRHVAIIFAPDIGKTYAIDDGARTVHVTPYVSPSIAPLAASRTARASATGVPMLRSDVEPLPATTLGRTVATGFHTHVVMHVAARSGTCARATVTSDRVEYFASIRIASSAANSSPFAPSDARDTCAPAGTVVAAGPNVPADRLLMYQANTIVRKTSAGDEQYTLVTERGDLRTAASARPGLFEMPEGYREI